MKRLRKALKVGVLALAMMCAVTLGAVFPFPPLLVLANRRRTDRTELILPSALTRLNLTDPVVPAGLLGGGMDQTAN